MESVQSLAAFGLSTRPPSPALPHLLELARAEYAEMPGLALTVAQARRLWAVDEQAALHALESLVDARVLRRTTGGRYVRID